MDAERNIENTDDEIKITYSSMKNNLPDKNPDKEVKIIQLPRKYQSDGDTIRVGKKLSIECRIRSGIVLITKNKHPLTTFFHAGIISVENDVPYIFHNDPHNINKIGGSIQRDRLDEYLKDKRIIEIYDSCTTTEQIHRKARELWGKKFNWITFNCENFIYEVTGTRLKRGIIHVGEKIIITMMTITIFFVFLKIIFSRK